MSGATPPVRGDVGLGAETGLGGDVGRGGDVGLGREAGRGGEAETGRGAGVGAAVPPGSRAWVVTVSDRVCAGEYEDRSGPLLAAGLTALGFAVTGPRCVPDEEDMIVEVLSGAVADRAALVVTTGGTGLAPRDVTPEATLRVVEREVPGLAEALRAAGRDAVPTAALSRGVAGVGGATLVVNLPGSTGGVRDGLAVLGGVVGHAVSQIRGLGDHAHPGGGGGGGRARAGAG
jgi:molybdenum cofactor biosynthesis protein B